jgi:hypothetical protein
MSKIIISQRYAIMTAESEDTGKFFDEGYITERTEVDFRGLVKLMSEHYLCSSSPWNRDYRDRQFSSDLDYIDSKGWHRQTSIRYHDDNDPSMYKYWVWARKISDANS